MVASNELISSLPFISPGPGRPKSTRTLIWLDDELKVQLVCWVWKVDCHCRWEVEFREVYSWVRPTRQRSVVEGVQIKKRRHELYASATAYRQRSAPHYSPFCTRIWAADVFGFFFAAASSVFFMDQICENSFECISPSPA